MLGGIVPRAVQEQVSHKKKMFKKIKKNKKKWNNINFDID